MNPYLNDSAAKRVILTFEGLILTNDDIQENMSLSEQVNTETDLQFGTCCAAELSFTVLDLSQELTKADFVGREFRLRRGVQTGESDVWGEMRRRGLFLAVRSGSFWYGVDRKGKSLAAWNGTDRMAGPVQPAQPVLSLLIRDGWLYCGHDGGAVTAYAIGADGALTQQEIALSSFERQKVERYNKRGDALNLTGDTMLLYRKEWAEGQVTGCAEQVLEFADAGYFTPSEAERKNDNLIEVKAYDRMSRFDVQIDKYLDSVKYPVTLRSYLQGLCSFCGVELATADFPNKDFRVRQNILTKNLPGRDVLGWIAEAAARFARFNMAGRLELACYTDRENTITADEYVDLSVSEYATLPVDKAQIKATDDDIGVIVGVGDNAYIVQGNPLFYADTDAELRPAAEAIYAEVAGLSYTPYSVRCRGNPLIRAGDVITVKSRKGQSIRALIMARTLKGVQALTDAYEATGNQSREPQPRENQSVTQLRGRVNEVSVTLEGTINRLYDANTGDITQLKLTTQGIEAEVGNQAGDISKLQQTAQGLSVSVSGVSKEMDGLAEKVSQNSAQILVQADQISSKVSETDYTGNTIVSMINQTASTILIQARKINLQGYVTISNLTDGSTTINGANIKTGTISADRIDSKILRLTDLTTKNLTINGILKNKGSYGGLTIESGIIKLQTSSYANNASIYYSTSPRLGLVINAGSGGISGGSTGNVTIMGQSGIYLKTTGSGSDIDIRAGGELNLIAAESTSSADVTIKCGQSGNIFLNAPGSSYRVIVGGSTSSFGDIAAKGYYCEKSAGVTKTFNYMKTSNSSGTITVKGGIITSVT